MVSKNRNCFSNWKIFFV